MHVYWYIFCRWAYIPSIHWNAEEDLPTIFLALYILPFPLPTRSLSLKHTYTYTHIHTHARTHSHTNKTHINTHTHLFSPVLFFGKLCVVPPPPPPRCILKVLLVDGGHLEQRYKEASTFHECMNKNARR